MSNYLSFEYDLNNLEVASIFDELSFWAARFGTLLFDNLELSKDLKILDLACGNGFPLFELANVFGSSSEITGVDIWQAGLARATLKQNIHKFPNVKILEANGENLPFSDSAFNLITSNLGINNFADPTKVILECYRVLLPKGKIVLTTNLNGHFQEFYRVFRDILISFNNQSYIDKLEANENHRGTKKSVSHLLESVGFDITKIIEDKFYMKFVDGSALLNHSLVKVGFLGGWKGCIDPKDQAEVFSKLETSLNDLANQQGQLKMTIPMLYIEAQKN
jgi:ubiquinone/menaquinone biosynthesis C-methylase UbiE